MKGLVTYILLLAACMSFSQEKDNGKPQEKDKNLPKGNKEYAGSKFADAETSYRLSGSKAPTNATASYNLGNAIYRQNMPGEAKYAYMKAIENAKTKQEKHSAYHNLGNTLMHEKNYQGAVEAYKNALRNNPADEQTRYNFALAKKMLKDNPPPPPPKDDKKDKKDDKKDQDNKSQQPKDNKDKEGDKDKGDQGDKDKKQGDKGDQKDKENKGGDGKDKPQPAQPSPSKQRMENLLDAMNNEEKKIQDKINVKKGKASQVKQEKDW